MKGVVFIAILSAAFLLEGRHAEASTPEQGGAAILAVSHDRERGITQIAVSAGGLPPCERINVFRSVSPITEDNLRFCPRVAVLKKDKAACSINSPDSGAVYYALTTSDEYNRQDKTLLHRTLVGPVQETCRTPPLPPIPWRRCAGGRAFVCWTCDADTNIAKFQVYQRGAAGRTLLGSVPTPDISGPISFAIPVLSAENGDGRFAVTAVNSSGLESAESAPICAARLPDLEVASGTTIAKNKDFCIGRMFPLAGKPVKMSVTVHNRGLVSARGVEVAVWSYHEASRTSRVLVERSVNVAADDSATVAFDWVPERLGEHRLKLVVDPCNRIAEIDKSNNQATVLVPVVRRNIYIVWYGNPLDVDWCNVPNCRLTDIAEWKRRGAVAAFCGMVGKNEPSYRQRIRDGFNGVEVDEIGGYDAGTADFLRWLTGIKTDHPDFFISLWMAGGVTAEMARNDRIDLFLGENYYNIGTPLSCFDGHIKRARDLGYCGKYVFGLGASEENARRLGHTHSIYEETAFLEQEMKYIAENAPEMPGIGLYGSRPGMNEKVDRLCYRYFVEPQFKGDQP